MPDNPGLAAARPAPPGRTMIARLVLAAWLSLTTPKGEVDGFARWARLEPDVAREHMRAATFAAALFDLDAVGGSGDHVLAIAKRESGYNPSEVTREPKRKTSCGVMTPIPKRGGCRPGGILAGYLEGSWHLRVWFDTCATHRDRRFRPGWRCAMLGYAGGGSLIRRCRPGVEIWRERVGRTGRVRRIDLCTVHRDRGSLAIAIGNARRRGAVP